MQSALPFYYFFRFYFNVSLKTLSFFRKYVFSKHLFHSFSFCYLLFLTKRLGQKSSLSIIFGLSSKTQWLSGLYYADFISFLQPLLNCAGSGTTKSNSNELPISVPLSFLFIHVFPFPVLNFWNVISIFTDIGVVEGYCFIHLSCKFRCFAAPRAALAASCAKWKRSNSDMTRISNGVVISPFSR